MHSQEHGHDLDSPLTAQTFRSQTYCIHTYSDLFHHTNMRFYMNLVILALVASYVSPAQSAPIVLYGNLLFSKGWVFLMSEILLALQLRFSHSMH